ncbi:MAG: hypothetical protein ABJA79_09495 [Parafilimonas sp.]
MITYQKILTRLQYILYDKIFKNIIFGYNKKTKSALNNDFKTGKWTFLESSEERTRHDNIIKLYKDLQPGCSILDIGCGQGILYKYLEEAFGNISHLCAGIDVSDTAIE